MKEIGENPYPTPNYVFCGIDWAFSSQPNFKITVDKNNVSWSMTDQGFKIMGVLLSAQFIEPREIHLEWDEAEQIFLAFESEDERRAAIALVKELIQAYERL